jgi:NADPH:quinone reductase-like Zn-dependent oxidoreductase
MARLLDLFPVRSSAAGRVMISDSRIKKRKSKGEIFVKAWQLRGFGRENLICTDVSIPKPGPSEILIRVSAVSLNYRDKLLVEGLYNPELIFPITQVADTVGDVIEIGSNVTRIAVGDRVVTQYATTWVDGDPKGDETVHTLGNTIPGGLAEYLSIHERAVVKAPSYLTDEEASTLPVAALTAWFSLIETGKLSSGQAVVLQGTGGVSLFGLQIVAAFGARSIITSSSDEKLERAKALGAYAGINYARTPEWEKDVLKLTGMQGADHVLEVVGGKSLAQSLASSKPGGRISVIGVLDGFVSKFPIFPLLNKQVTIRGIVTGPRRVFDEMNQALEKTQLRPVIDKVYPFEDALAAYDHLYRGAFGKIVIRVRE